jgi:hypothetical protein
MKLITYATHESGYYEALKISATKNGFTLVTLGFNQKWEGFTQRFIEIKNYLETYSNKDEIICFVDGFDCIVLGTSQEMLKKYTNHDKILFAADSDSYFATEIFGEINKKDKNHKYNRLNAGCYIGKVKNILELLVNLCNFTECKAESNDQTLMTLYYNKCIDCLDIDHNRNLFYNLKLDINNLYWQYLIISNTYKKLKAPLENKYYKFINNRIILNNGNIPIILHGNGDTNMDLIVEKLGYPISINKNKDYYNYSIKPFINIIKNKYPLVVNLLYYLLTFTHTIFVLYTYIYVYFTNNVFNLSILVFIIHIIILHWYIVGNCCLSPIENALKDPKQVDQGRVYSYLLEPLIFLFGENFAYNFTTFYPTIVLCIALYKINKQLAINN